MLIWTPIDKANSKTHHSNGETTDSVGTEEANDGSKSHGSTAAAAAVSLAAANDRGSGRSKGKVKRMVEVLHVDIIGNKFWTEHTDILRGE